MDREVNLPPPPEPDTNLTRPSNPDSTSSSSSSVSSTSQHDFVRDVLGAFKRHRPLGVMQSSSIGPRRILVPQRGISKNSASNVGPVVDTEQSQEIVSTNQVHTVNDSMMHLKETSTIVKESLDDASITPSSISGTITKAFDQNLNPFNVQRDQTKPIADCNEYNPKPPLHVESHHIDGQKKVQFSIASEAASRGADELMATGLENLSSHMGSLALTEMEWVSASQGEASTGINHDLKNQNMQNTESNITFRSDGGISSLLGKRTTAVQDQLHHFRNFLSQPNTQSSVVGASCATTTYVHSTSAPLLNQTTICSRLHSKSHSAEPLGNFNVTAQPISQGKCMQPSNTCLKDTCGMLGGQIATVAQTSTSATDTQMEVKKEELSKEQQGCVHKESGSDGNLSLKGRPTDGKQLTADVTDVRSQAPSKSFTSDVRSDTSKLDRQQDKVASGKGASVRRKRNYDPDLFFKVNGQLYQRLGKIGSGGSSEVHKVISSDCTIYALKKIKLRGRDYATAYGFCQEIEYLNKLRGKHNIIQLIDYEVTDKALLEEVMNGSMCNKDGRVKDDGYIYMVLEYGEIDLAHMLSQKWKEMDSSNQSIDENWLRFYWQQILLAVNTIHEERIVHSDLKPANFLLVKGSLKLIDFGIAKAIMSDTTHIQRDGQVGTLSYMSPEAFMCNELDANGNPIKCGRPSDIWSLGCILYQMVYGRTPFSEYKTFYSKFKVITDRNYQITYEQVPNPWLLNLLKKCLAWDPNERWRIPQLLQHPFLVPPIPSLQLIFETCSKDTESSKLCSELQQVLTDPNKLISSQLLTSRDQQCKLLSQISLLCFQLHKQLENSERLGEDQSM
ncbi:hypothetical protein UlMin_034561 [Ulmus minor]